VRGGCHAVRHAVPRCAKRPSETRTPDRTPSAWVRPCGKEPLGFSALSEGFAPHQRHHTTPWRISPPPTSSGESALSGHA
jgi:hypothetical protein